MEQEREHNDDLIDLENRLRELSPVPAQLDTARTLFLAGQQSVSHQKSSWQIIWPLATAGLTAACLMMAFLLMETQSPQIVYVPLERPADSAVAKTLPNQPNPLSDRNVPSPRSVAQAPVALPTDGVWRDVLELRRQQSEILNGSLQEAELAAEPTELVNVAPVRYCDWPTLLTEANVTERIPPANLATPFDWIAIFSTKGS